MSDKNIYIIVAVDKNNGIGKDNKMPWHFKKEIEYFKDTTMETMEFGKKNMVIMGRKTWESIDEKYRPLEGRENVIISRNRDYKAEGATVYYSLGEALKMADNMEEIENIFIIGGAQIFELALPIANGIYLTRIDKVYDCDSFLPEVPERYLKTPERLGEETEKGVTYSFMFYPKDKDYYDDL